MVTLEFKRARPLGFPIATLAASLMVAAGLLLYMVTGQRSYELQDVSTDFRSFTEQPTWWSYRDIKTDLEACDDISCLSRSGLELQDLKKLSLLAEANNRYAVAISLKLISMDHLNSRYDSDYLKCCYRYIALNPVNFLEIAQNNGLASYPSIATYHPEATDSNIRQIELDLNERRKALLKVSSTSLRRIRDGYVDAITLEIERLDRNSPPGI
jgi:hypothetical protein